MGGAALAAEGDEVRPIDVAAAGGEAARKGGEDPRRRVAKAEAEEVLRVALEEELGPAP